MTMTTTRAMTRDDLSAIAVILAATQLFPPDLLADMADPYLQGAAPDIWRVACDGDRVVGFCFCEPERMTDGTFTMLAIAVAPAGQRRGSGRCLVASAEAMVRAAGGRVLLVETSSLADYAGTRAFYDGLGYDREAVIREFYAAGEDKIVFRKQL